MPCFTPDFSFAAPVQCAAVWFMHVAAHHGLQLGRTVEHIDAGRVRLHEPGTVLHAPGRVKDRRGNNLPSITFRRHPADWIRSVYQARLWMVGEPIQDRIIALKGTRDDYLRNIQAVPFMDFVERYIAEMPGEITRMFAKYESDHNIDLADLPHGFLAVLDAIVPESVKWDRRAIAETPPMNAAPAKLQWPSELYERFCAAEGCEALALT